MKITPPDPPLKAARIMAVDDEPANLSLVERAFHREGFQDVATFLDARDALAEFAARMPDLVLLDLMMPGVDGYELLESFRRLTPETDYLPILVLTADSTMNARLRALSLGANDVLLKPYDVAEILMRSWVLLDTRRRFKAVSAR
ncbi:response regulator [Brevundimonas subvibrioides]|uniref:Response regulator receiver protein n=1 Tax=Brevundimonas subvibrioides (strain ATCC 15264 / DSM 4735 / LMG 14903 / NBRC 16000 / CB 81) TaxID=633149 RepID=D9QLD2_BRESC|nr:response regulator [Brevundimonas subvibrioides]ADK99987.1 response regulator receiver protein [Brevundimonas subvibrioides ATCC 15264]